MSNPVMSRNPYFQQATQSPQNYQQGYANPQGFQQTQYADNYTQQFSPQGYPQQGYPQQGFDQLGYHQAGMNQFDQQRQAFGQQGAFQQGYSTSGSMTYMDAMNKTALLLAITVISGVAAAIVLPPAAYSPVAIATSLAAFVVGLVLAFQKVVKPALAIAYTVLEGIALGAITVALDTMLPGVAFQAITATIIIVAVTLGLHYSGAVRTSSKGRKIVLAVAVAGLIFALLNFILMITGVTEEQWGLRSVEVGGIPLGIILGAIMILVGAYMLIADFEDVNTAIAHNAPKEFAWTCGIAIVMSVLWIYIEVLRIAAILASDR